MKPKKESKYYFLFSCLSMLLANNWHFISPISRLPRLFDWLGLGLFVFGLTVFFKEENL